MGYSQVIEHEKEILQQYALSRIGMAVTTKRRASLTSNIMFIERYADLLRDGGSLVTVIDDSVLSSPNFAFARNYIRERFIIRAVISLPGDAFQQVGARAKTSILFLTNRADGEEGQPDIFMAECQYVGIDDMPAKTRTNKALEAKKNAEQEINDIVRDFKTFQEGGKGPWIVSSNEIKERMDVKYCLPRPNKIEDIWAIAKIDIVPLADIVDHIVDEGFDPGDSPLDIFTLLRVRYDGVAEEGEKALGQELTYSDVQRPRIGDLVVSNIAAAMGSTCVIPEYLTHVIASSEFTIMRIKDDRFHPWFLWGFLRSIEVRARLVSQSSGTNRQRVGWDDLKALPVPLVDENTQKEFGEKFKTSVSAILQAERTRYEATAQMNQMLDLDNTWAVQRLKSAKPPR
ncbi:MAG: N-6 DNA methylase [Janthinobacterium lividum]